MPVLSHMWMRMQSVARVKIVVDVSLLLPAPSYVGSRSSSNMAIVEVKMLSGFSPVEGTKQSVSGFCFFY